MRVKKIINCCSSCMQKETVGSSCAVCQPRDAFPSAFSSQAEWDNDEE